MKNTNYKTRRCKIFSPPFTPKTFRSTPTVGRPQSTCLPKRTKCFTPKQNKKQEYSFAYYNIDVPLVADVKTTASRSNHEKLHSWQPVSGLRYESGNSWIQVRSEPAIAQLLGCTGISISVFQQHWYITVSQNTNHNGNL